MDVCVDFQEWMGRYFTSYRDPNLRNTNLVYERIPEFIRNFTADERI